MSHPKITATSVTTVGVAMILVGAMLVGAVVLASGAGATGQSITVTPHSGLTAAKHVVFSGSGFAHRSSGVILECNLATGEPALVIPVNAMSHLIPVGCTSPVPAKTSNFGRLRARTLPVVVGTLGTWETGTDSAGLLAAADAAAYPCPPTAAQMAEGASCAFEFLDNKDQVATRSVTFKSTGSTTSTTLPTTTTTTTAGGPCSPRSATVTATPPNGTATVTVDPGTCLVGGSVATVVATGLLPASNTNFLGTLLECNSDPNQPTVSLLGSALPVSCTPALARSFTPNAAGTFSGTFAVVDGVTGPPTTGTDSNGVAGSVDAANYPCPPTPAEVSVGDTCLIVISDTGGDHVSVPISFNPNVADPGTSARS